MMRRSRLQDALGLTREGVTVSLHRNRLLERLAQAADDPATEFDSLPDGTVDTVVSLALAEIEESALDALVVVLLCIRVLAADGQFARLSLLADRLGSLGRRLSVERPFVSCAVSALALVLQSKARAAEHLLQERLGIGDRRLHELVQVGHEQVNDLLMAASLLSVLSAENPIFAERALQAAVSAQDGLLLSYIEAVLSWYDAAGRAINDDVWGPGNWIRCSTCPHDSRDREVYHHKDAH